MTTTPKAYQKQTTVNKNPRRRRLEIPLQADFASDPKFIHVIQRCGWSGVGHVFLLAGQLWREADCRLGYSSLPPIAWAHHIEIDALKATVAAAVESGLFVQASDCQAFYSPFISREAEAFDLRCSNLRQYTQPIVNTDSDADSGAESGTGSAPSTGKTGKSDQSGKSGTAVPTVPAGTPGTDWLDKPCYPPALRAAVRTWQKVLKEKHNRTLGESEMEAYLMNYAHRIPELIRDINTSAGNGWKTLNQTPAQPPAGGAPARGNGAQTIQPPGVRAALEEERRKRAVMGNQKVGDLANDVIKRIAGGPNA